MEDVLDDRVPKTGGLERLDVVPEELDRGRCYKSPDSASNTIAPILTTQNRWRVNFDAAGEENVAF